MRKPLLLCSLILLVLAGVAYIARAQDDPGFNFPPIDAPPQARIDFYENEIKKCKDYIDELTIGINKAEILFADARAKNTHLFAGFGWSKQISGFERQVEIVCHRIKLHQDNIRDEMDKVPPAPSPTPTPSPATDTKSGQSIDPLKNKQIGERNEEIKFIKEYRQKISELKTGANRIFKEIDDYAKTGKTNQPAPGFNAESVSTGGLWTTTFTVPQGRFIVNLPADIRAGDTISGTVLTEPNGKTDAERTLNRDALNQYEVMIAIPRDAGQNKYMWQEIVTTVNRQPGQPVASFDAVMHPSPSLPGGAAAVITYGTSTATFTIHRPGVYLLEAEIEATLRRPTIGQNGRPAETKGPFDGNLRNTEIRIGGQPVSILAESPRSCIFGSPEQNFGPTDITIKENNVETKGAYRNLGVRLSAPKTNLVKGESTTVTITVDGLKGIQQNIPLLLEKKGDVSMEGGDVQTIQIRPNDVVILGSEGKADVRKVVIGLRPGFFNITATVIDPAHRPIIIPLIENGRVNGHRVQKDGDALVAYIDNVKHPLKGEPVDGKHRLEYRCPQLSQLPYINTLFLNKGRGKMKTECLIMITPRIIITDEN